MANIDDSISEIAWFLGNESSSAFTKAFGDIMVVGRAKIAVDRVSIPRT
jgi:hypothetical protein